MYSWGSATNGELGQGGVEEANIPTPTKLKLTHILPCSVSPGGRHTLVLANTGELYSCGSNDFGQLGREGSQSKLEQVSSLAEYTLKGISSGSNHSLAVDQWGSTFSWGSDDCGQLGHNQGAQTLRIPRLIKSLGSIKVARVAAGSAHSAVLTAAGQLFTWGSNSKGQLGLGGVGPPNSMVFSPSVVESLAGVPLAGLACGGHHTLVVSVSGALFAFGSNSQGQLGTGDHEDKSLPTQVKTMRNQKIATAGLAAGSEHSVALTLDGGVFTWGSGRYGQLGHGGNHSENLPKKIVELMGTKVTQVSAGDRHTLALVSSGKLYAFGVAGSGQLGRGPDYMQNAFLPQLVNVSETETSLIAAGGNSSWLATGPKEYSQLTTGPGLSLLDRKLLDSIASVSEDEMLEQDLMEQIELVFSSLSCINGSLLTPNHHGCRGSNCGLDFSLWKEAFSIIAKCKNDTVPSLVMSGLLSVLGQLKTSPPDVEALRYYLILPLHHTMQDPANASDFQIPFADAVMSLQKIPLKVVEKWFGTAPPEWFKELINAYIKVVTPFLKMLKSANFVPRSARSFMVALVFLTLLTRVNEEAGWPVSIEHFYIKDLHRFCDLKSEYCRWKFAKMQGRDITEDFYICNFPFLFDPAAKETVLMADQEFSQQLAQQSAVQDAMFQMMTSGQALINPFININVSRENIVQDTIAQLEFISYHGHESFKKPLKVTFRDEEAEDEGGVTKEFFLLLIKEILNPDYGMFKEYDETNTIWFNPSSFETSEYFTMIGIVCGLAIYNFTIINLAFPLVLYKKLLEVATEELADLAELSPTTAKSLQDLLDYPDKDVEDVFSLTFSINESFFGEVVTKPLKTDGENVAVTAENKAEYVKLYVDYVLNKSCQAHFNAFKAGFHKVLNKQVLHLFQAKELMALVIGNENYNWDVFQDNCEYKEGYSKNHDTIKHFWEVFRELTEDDKRKFLLFLTGSDRIPVRGMESVKMTIQRTSDTSFLPVAHTCFNLLDLPEYGTKEKLKFKLSQAIQQTKGFGLV